MPGLYEMRYDRSDKLFFYSMHGFWTMATIKHFIADLEATAARIPRPLVFDTLCDTVDFPIQSHEVSEALGRIMAAAVQMRTGRTAVAVGSRLSKMQAERTLAHPTVKVFLSLDEARAWLAEGSRP